MAVCIGHRPYISHPSTIESLRFSRSSPPSSPQLTTFNMASLRSSAFQSLLRTRNCFIRPQQRRWAQVHDVRFLATHHDPNQVMDRYRGKLNQKAKE